MMLAASSLAFVLSLGAALFAPAGAKSRLLRSLALLAVLASGFALLAQLAPRQLGEGASLALFLGTFWVIYLMGRFDSPE